MAPITMSHEDIASYLRIVNAGVEAKEFGEDIADGVELEALFKIRVPVDDAEAIETPLREFLEQFPQARMEKIV
ncbi:hypothetical protein EDS67_22675 [candidate division KSB1 bacterium]|nr:MAG: hypothetical protein EDS67_22675 [candidate division KSB1 bacterium]MBC6951456.1 hypothetical protein [candidate division KSB1 bacterium]MCE7945093.1 hypothetical protein [Chlorobi bacterium CHB1]MDL1874235.1 hypothetical protein [Cytophagia bacterium CHB2]